MIVLQLIEMSERTLETCTRAVRQVVDFYNKTPDLITEQELHDNFLHRKNIDKWSAVAMRIGYRGVKFLFINRTEIFETVNFLMASSLVWEASRSFDPYSCGIHDTIHGWSRIPIDLYRCQRTAAGCRNNAPHIRVAGVSIFVFTDFHVGEE
jgi:hypothetical protein